MISAIVLAAGQATRFGQCKQLVPLGEKPLLQHVLDNLRQSCIDDVVVVLGAYADDIQRQVRFTKERVVINPDYAQGMSTSLQAGLRSLASETEAAMIVLADQPFVASKTLDALIDEYKRTRPSVVIPTYNGFRGNPVLVDKSLFPEMMNIRGDIGCRAIFGDHVDSISKVTVDDRGVVTDIDTPEDIGVPARAPAPTPNTDDIQEQIVELRRRRQPFSVATVVRAERPTSSKPGDKAIVSPDGTLTGWIGGSCAHDIVVKNALEALDEGTPRFLTLSSEGPAEAKRFGVIDVPMRCYSGGVLDIFIEPNLPKPQMVVIGCEAVAKALVRIGKALQFHVVVVDPLATGESLPEADQIVNALSLSDLPMSGESFVVIATHGRYDEEALEQAVLTSASYVALVASPKRAGVILQQLRERGVSGLERVKSPAGLDIGAQGAEEIGLSIVAEIVQERRAGRLKRPAVSAPQPLEAVDPVCHMTVTIADARYSTEHEGRRYYFCCAQCQRTFEKEPQRCISTAR
jgi:xanthine dehydrogenase accessory factor